MTDHPNAALVRQYLEGEIEDYANAIDDDIEWWEIGRDEPIVGKAALMAHMEEQAGLYEIDGSVHDVVANDEHAIALINATGKGTAVPSTTRWPRSITFATARSPTAGLSPTTPRRSPSSSPERLVRFDSGFPPTTPSPLDPTRISCITYIA